MKNFKHTLGPWNIDAIEKEGEIHICPVNEHISIATIYAQPLESQEYANAKLIAAAPDLLKAILVLDDKYKFAHINDVPTMIEKAANILEIKAVNDGTTSKLVEPLLQIAKEMREAINKAI
jgi:hypothetical protein